MKSKKSWLLWATIGLLAGGGLAWLRTPATVSTPTTSAPTTAPAENIEPSLTQRCRDAAATLEPQLDPTFSVLVDPPFVVAGNMRTTDLAAHMEHSVLRPAAAMWQAYFTHQPDQPITVLLLTDRGVRPGEDKNPGYAYRTWSQKLFGEQAANSYGYYEPDRRTLIMNIDTGSGTLTHELTHALIVYDFPDPPDWFNEALATLHEQCRVEENGLVGLPNWRLPALQQAMADGALRPLADLVTKNDFRTNQEGLNYAQARYFAMYLQHRNKLREFYSYYRGHRDNPVAAIEHVLGKSMDDVEKTFLAWVKTLRFE